MGGLKAKDGGLRGSPYLQESGGLVSVPRGRYRALVYRLRRLNRGLDTSQWKVYERKEEPSGVRLVLSIDSQSVTMLFEVETFQRRRTGSFLPSLCQTGRKEVRKGAGGVIW